MYSRTVAVPLLVAAALVVAPSRTPAWAAANTPQPAPMPPRQEARDDECSRGRPEPILARSPAAPVTFERLGPYEAKEAVALRDQIAVTVRQFGCAHYATEYAFSIPDTDPKALPPRAGLERAAQLLEQLPVVPAQAQATRLIAAFLHAKGADEYRYGNVLQMSETESVQVRVEAASPGTKLMVLYDVAL